MPNIDPKVGTWVNFIALILAGIGAGTVEFASVSDAMVELIKVVARDGLFVITCANLVFHLYSAPTAGPLAKQ